MVKTIMEKLGYNLYCVAVTATGEKYGDYAGMFICMMYAQSDSLAIKKVMKKLTRNNFTFTGNWDYDVEIV